MSALLEISGLEVAYGPSQVLFGVALNMAEGEAATLLGRNGMGKTTTLRAICGLVTNPRLLILDEATEGLAPLIREEIWACLARLRGEGQSVLVIDKYVEKLIELADRHTIIERGQVVWQGGSAALDADHAIWHRYLGL